MEQATFAELEHDLKKRRTRREASSRAKAAHRFPRVKRRVGGAKVPCRGLAKNTRRIAVPLELSNPLVAGRCAA